MKTLRVKKEPLVNSDDENTWLLLDSDYTRVSKDEGSIVHCFNYLRDPNYRPYRYCIAMLLAMIQGVSSYLSDLPGGIQTTIIRVMRMDDAHYDMIFSAYTWADVVMSVAGSVIVNQYIGIHVGFIVFLALILAGQLLCSVGCFFNSFWIFLIGRLIAGSGTGTSISILNSFQILWFGGKEITFIMSLSRCMCRLMATLALFTPQLTYNGLTFIRSPLNRLGTTQMVGTLFGVLAIFCGLCVVILDKYGARFIGRRPPKKNAIHVLDAFQFPHSFWLIAIQCSLYYSAVISFTANGSLFFICRYGLDIELANLANSLSYASIVVLTPFIALAIDFVGYNLVWGYIGIWFQIVSCLLYIGGSETSWFIPFLAATLSSCSFAFFGSAMWVLPGLLVERHQITTAYGVFMSVFALFLSVVGIVAGVIIDNYGYLVLIIYYILILVSASLLNIYSSMMDFSADKRVLNVSGKTRLKK